jgi:hypothetical protein
VTASDTIFIKKNKKLNFAALKFVFGFYINSSQCDMRP